MPDSSSSQCRRCSLDNVEASRSRFPGPSDSLFERYKNCNVYPLVHEADSIKAEMGGAMWREYLLDARIVQLHSTIASLTAEKSRIKEVVEKYRLILRPVLRLPPELLTRIFAFTEDCSTPQDKDKDRYNENQPPSSLDSSRMPWALAQVCRLWRNLSLATPSLWRFVSVTSKVFEQSDDGYIENAPGIIQAQVYRLSLQLQRSGEYPLDVFSSVRNSTAGIVNPLQALLYSQSHRWRTFRIQLDRRDAPTMSLIRGRLPSLESLHVRCIGEQLDELDCFEFAPRLRTLTLSGEVRGLTLGRFPLKLPRDQIKHFRSYNNAESSTYFSSCHNLLTGFPQLQTCRLSFHSQYIATFLRLRHHPVGTNLHLSLPRLTELELDHTERASGIEAMLFWIKAPATLRTLSIYSTGRNRTPFVEFLTYPESLTSLTVRRVEMAPSEFRAVLALLTGLYHLKFGVRTGLTNDYLELLRATVSDGFDFSIVPKLRSLALLPVTSFSSLYDNDLLAKLLEDRWRGHRAADSISVYTSNDCPPSHRLLSVELDRRIVNDSPVRNRLDRLRGEGMRIIEEMTCQDIVIAA